MLAYVEQPTATAAQWAMRIGLFSAAMVVAAIPMHRLLGMGTPTFLNLLLVAFCGAAVALVLSAVSAIQIWRSGQPGTAAALTGALTASALLAWPAVFFAISGGAPVINDVTTDVVSPPPFAALAGQRGPGANPVSYNSAALAPLQAAAYPDLRPFLLDRPVDEAFELAVESLRYGLKYEIVAEVPPNQTADGPGIIEAVDRTLIMGFYDDIVIRVIGDKVRSRIDIRSASRYGRGDFGHNAARVRTILRDIKMRLDNSVPMTAGQRVARMKSRFDKTAVAKRRKGSDRGPADRRSEQDRARSDAQRGPEPKAKRP